MADMTPTLSRTSVLKGYLTPGMLCLVLAVVGSGIFFIEGINALLVAWQLPEYSHGPLIPVLSGLLMLRQLKDVPVETGPVRDRWPGVALLIFAVLLGLAGKLSRIDDIVAYALILWVGAVLLISFGWKQGRQFWPGVLHLVYMLPLPGVLYYKMSTYLQMVSSELGVFFLKLMNIPVFLSGNIIDLGVFQLHVAEACSGLRYLFPIMSFSYIFAALYRGPMWHKAVLLLAAAPISILMNSVRIAFAGWIVNYVGLDYLEGFSHFFEGWVIFVISVALLFLMAWGMLRLHPDRPRLADALDLETAGLGAQLARIRLVEASRAMIIAVAVVGAAALAWEMRPTQIQVKVDREPFVLFPRQLGDWSAGPRQTLSLSVEEVLGADDYHSVTLTSPEAETYVDLFIAWYEDQSDGGTHSPEVCLPGAGWEIAWLERSDIGPVVGLGEGYEINRAVIQKGMQRMMGYYWFEQHGRHVAWDYEAKFWLLVDGITTGRTDGGLVRLLTPIQSGESEEAAEERLKSVFLELDGVLPRFIPDA